MTKVTMIVASVAAASAVAVTGYLLGQARGARTGVPTLAAEAADSVEKLDNDAKLAGTMGRLERRLASLEMRQAAAPPSEQTAPAPQAAAAQPE